MLQTLGGADFDQKIQMMSTYRGPTTDTRWQRLERVRERGKVRVNLWLWSIFKVINKPWISEYANGPRFAQTTVSWSHFPDTHWLITTHLLFSVLPLQRDPIQQWPVPEHQHHVRIRKNKLKKYFIKEIVSPTIMISISAPARRTATGRATPRTSVPPRAEAWQETARLGKNRRGVCTGDQEEARDI